MMVKQPLFIIDKAFTIVNVIVNSQNYPQHCNFPIIPFENQISYAHLRGPLVVGLFSSHPTQSFPELTYNILLHQHVHFFNCYFTALQPTLGHLEPLNEVGSQNPEELLVVFELGSFLFIM